MLPVALIRGEILIPGDRCMTPFPAGRYDMRRRAWVYPATHSIAYRVRRAGFPVIGTEILELAQAIDDADAVRKAGDAPEPSVIPSWRHQRVAHAFASRLNGCGLFMDMGTGKTKVSIDLIRTRQAKRVLIVCPKRVVPVWCDQIPMWGDSDWKFSVLTSKSKEWNTGIGVINYESVWRPTIAKMLVDNPPDMIILDESHRIKGAGSNVSRFLAVLGRRAEYRLALTGTPAHDTPLDVYAQMRFIDPGVFGVNKSTFVSRFAIMGGFENRQVIGYKNLDELAIDMATVTFRVENTVLELPESTDVKIPVDLSPGARRIYRDLNSEFISEVEGGVITAQNALVKITRLQQITGGTLPLDGGEEREIDHSKEEALVELLGDLPKEERVVVFAKFTADLDRIIRAAFNAKRESHELSGRDDSSQQWKHSPGSVLAVQIRSGGSGVDLTAARYGVYYSVGHSLGDYDQSRSRILRPGQKHPVTFHHLVAAGTVDVDVYRALRNKTNVVDEVMSRYREDSTCYTTSAQ